VSLTSSSVCMSVSSRFPPVSSASVCPLASPFFFASSADRRALHSFPTRRSSDLGDGDAVRPLAGGLLAHVSEAEAAPAAVLLGRSEEHTSELQSRFDLVCRLLLEKKK